MDIREILKDLVEKAIPSLKEEGKSLKVANREIRLLWNEAEEEKVELKKKIVDREKEDERILVLLNKVLAREKEAIKIEAESRKLLETVKERLNESSIDRKIVQKAKEDIDKQIVKLEGIVEDLSLKTEKQEARTLKQKRNIDFLVKLEKRLEGDKQEISTKVKEVKREAIKLQKEQKNTEFYFRTITSIFPGFSTAKFLPDDTVHPSLITTGESIEQGTRYFNTRENKNYRFNGSQWVEVKISILNAQFLNGSTLKEIEARVAQKVKELL